MSIIKPLNTLNKNFDFFYAACGLYLSVPSTATILAASPIFEGLSAAALGNIGISLSAGGLGFAAVDYLFEKASPRSRLRLFASHLAAYTVFTTYAVALTALNITIAYPLLFTTLFFANVIALKVLKNVSTDDMKDFLLNLASRTITKN